jgi:hypothetical protein
MEVIWPRILLFCFERKKGAHEPRTSRQLGFDLIFIIDICAFSQHQNNNKAFLPFFHSRAFTFSPHPCAASTFNILSFALAQKGTLIEFASRVKKREFQLSQAPRTADKGLFK